MGVEGNDRTLPVVMAGLDPAIHVFELIILGVDHRVKPGDETPNVWRTC
jgi:hypothetical protein